MAKTAKKTTKAESKSSSKEKAKAPAKSASKTTAKAASKPAKVAVAAKKETAPKKEASAKKETPLKKESSVQKETPIAKAPPILKDVSAKKAEKPAKVAADEDDFEVAEKPAAVPKIGKREKAARAAVEKTTADELKKWTDYKQKYGGEKATPYSMSGVYEAGKALQHKVLGWGYIINVQNDRLEVLFENGPKMLISNYKAG